MADYDKLRDAVEALDLTGQDLSDEDLSQSNLERTDLIGVNLANANLTDANFCGVTTHNPAVDDALKEDCKSRFPELHAQIYGGGS